MLLMAIPDVEILAVRSFTVCFNVFDSGTNDCGSRGVKLIRCESHYAITDK